MCCCKKNGLRSLDLFGTPVSLVYKGKPTFQTRVGGCFSVVFAVVILTSFVHQFVAVVFHGADFSSKVETRYNFYDSGGDNMLADVRLSPDYTLMGELYAVRDFGGSSDIFYSKEIDQSVRIQFYEVTMETLSDGSHFWNYTFVPAVYCRDKYAKWIETNPENDVAKKISGSGQWVCPDVDEIVLQRNPFMEADLDGRGFVMVVNDCEVAKEIDKSIVMGSLPQYAQGKECLATEEERLAKVPQIMLDTRIMGLRVDVQPDGETEERCIKARSSTGLIRTLTQASYTGIIPNELLYPSNIREQVSLLFSRLFTRHSRKADQVTYTFESLQQGLVENVQDLSKNPYWGYNSISLVESTKIITVKYSNGGISTVLSVVGGVVAFFFPFISVLLGGYQKFAYQKSSYKVMYLEDSKEPKDDDKSDGGPRSSFVYADQREGLTPRSELQRKFQQGANFSQNYHSLLLVRLLSCLCNCWLKRYDTPENENGWYRRNMQRLRRLELAQAKLNSELDVSHFMTEMRLVQIIKKVILNRRQRLAVAYFRRYTVRNKSVNSTATIEQDKQSQSARDNLPALASLATDFDPQEDPIDRRIFYEITGRRLSDSDFRDDSPGEDSGELPEDGTMSALFLPDGNNLRLLRRSQDVNQQTRQIN